MKMNKWTVGLAAVGLVSLTSAQAQQQPTLVPVLTQLPATTISGYVDTSAVWQPGTGAKAAPVAFNGLDAAGSPKKDGFNLDNVDLKFAKEIDPTVSAWTAGYTAELNVGPDANSITGGSAIRQAYIKLRVPVANNIDVKVGRFDTIIGYETPDSYRNPNWSRSYGFTSEPTEHTGVLAEYRFNDWILADAGIANTVTTADINAKSQRAESKKAYMGLITLTVPEGKWGPLSGDALYLGIEYGPGSLVKEKTHLYVGSTINTPLKDLTFGVAYDAIFQNDNGVLNNNTTAGSVVNGQSGYFSAIAGYVNYKLTEKLSAAGRVELAKGQYLDSLSTTPGNSFRKVLALTGTLSYDLWANVLTRVEVRWDHSLDRPFGGTGVAGEEAQQDKNVLMVAANLVYKF